jgi:hypothetical protein
LTGSQIGAYFGYCLATADVNGDGLDDIIIGKGENFKSPRGKYEKLRTVIRFLWVSAKFGTCTVVSVNGTPVEDKICTFTLESTHFFFNLCPIYNHDGASVKFSTNSQETDYSARLGEVNISFDFMNHAFGFSSELQAFAVTVP